MAVVAHTLRVMSVHRQVLVRWINENPIFLYQTALWRAYFTENVAAVATDSQINRHTCHETEDSESESLRHEPAMVFTAHPIKKQLAAEAYACFCIRYPAHGSGQRLVHAQDSTASFWSCEIDVAIYLNEKYCKFWLIILVLKVVLICVVVNT